MKKFFTVIITFMVFCLPVEAITFDLKSTNAILYNLNEDTVLYEEKSEENVAIASLTKIMTAIVAVENITDLNEEVTLLPQDFASLVEQNASVAGFRIYEKVTYQDLLYGLLLPSGADAAQALTRLIAGNRTKFVQLMNAKAQELGMKDTVFTNETGLDEKGQKATVKDVATMLKYALKNPILKQIMTSKSYTMTDKSLTVYSTTATSVNALGVKMDYLLGGKTGTTKNAGKCLASYAKSKDTEYVLVTIGAPMTSKPLNVLDAKTIYEYFINNYSYQNIIQKGDVILNTINAQEKEIHFMASEDVTKYLPNDFKPTALKYDYEGMEEVPFNTPKGTKLGSLNVYYNDDVILQQDIILNQDLTLDLGSYLQSHIEIVIISVTTMVLLIIFVLIKRKKHVRVS